MDKQYLSLDEILADSEFGNVFTSKSSNNVATADQRLIDSFEEVNRFIDSNGHQPNNQSDINHRKLITRLASIRHDVEKIIALKPYDRHELLQIIEKPIESIDDILADDFLSSLLNNNDNAVAIFDLKHVQHNSERQESDFIARRKVCKKFHNYEPLFKQCQADLKLGKRTLISFDENNLVAGTYFILNGQLGYLESISAPVKRGGNRHDGRTYCVFENGTESNMQFLSLAARLYQARTNSQAFTLSMTQEEADKKFIHNFNQIDAEDKSTGYIYILKSRSNNYKISNIDNLYKIGYSTTPVEERIKNAANEPTYLMAAVEIVSSYQCYNLNPQKFENIIHIFFAAACLNLDIFGEDGKRYNPREWFVLPLEIIEQAIGLIINGDIAKFKFDNITNTISWCTQQGSNL